VIFVGDDWAEAHHDVAIVDEQGRRLAQQRLPEGLTGVARLHALLAEHASEPSEVVIGIETDRGLWVSALTEAGYQVYAINPLSMSRYRDRHATSGGKSDAGDALVLADVVRTDRHQHRTIAADTELAEAIKILARTHQTLIWTRQRELSRLRAVLREFYPAALEAFGDGLAERDALAVLGRAPTPEEGRRLSRSALQATLRRGGRQRNVEARVTEIQTALRHPQLAASPRLTRAFGVASVSWTPCPALGSVESACWTHQAAGVRVWLSTSYSMGVRMPRLEWRRRRL
jgi:transposase